MTEKFSGWDSADYLKTDEDIAMYFAICTEEALKTHDASYIAHALGVVARAKAMAQITGKTG
jgi:probable addiction module antidote protein